MFFNNYTILTLLQKKILSFFKNFFNFFKTNRGTPQIFYNQKFAATKFLKNFLIIRHNLSGADTQGNMVLKSAVDPATPLFCTQVVGKWQNTYIFYTSRGKQRIRVMTAYDKLAKSHLSPFQNKFAQAVAAWQGLSTAQKEFYNRSGEAKYRRLPGYNVYISQFLKS